MNEPSRDNPEANNLFAQTNEEADGRFRNYKSKDPFPEIQPALLNSADIYDYVRVTGMLFPFDERPGKLKSASYEIDLLGEVHLWDDERKKQVIPIKNGKQFILQKNSIVFVFLATKFRIPDYIALRFNLRIKHVHRGLLLGTGPLIDPGFEGKLLIHLHNLTSDDYEFEGGEGFIWVEFTKVSPIAEWIQNSKTQTRSGKYIYFPEDKMNRTPEYYFEKASMGNSIRSSISDTLLSARQSALAAERDAKRAESSVKKFTRMFYGIRVVSLLALGWTLYSSFSQIMSLVQDTTLYVRSESKDIDAYKRKIDKENLRFQNDLVDKLGSLEKELQELKKRVENIAKSPGSVP